MNDVLWLKINISTIEKTAILQFGWSRSLYRLFPLRCVDSKEQKSVETRITKVGLLMFPWTNLALRCYWCHQRRTPLISLVAQLTCLWCRLINWITTGLKPVTRSCSTSAPCVAKSSWIKPSFASTTWSTRGRGPFSAPTVLIEPHRRHISWSTCDSSISLLVALPIKMRVVKKPVLCKTQMFLILHNPAGKMGGYPVQPSLKCTLLTLLGNDLNRFIIYVKCWFKQTIFCKFI